DPRTGAARERDHVDRELALAVVAGDEARHHARVDRLGDVEDDGRAQAGNGAHREAAQHLHVRVAAPDEDEIAARLAEHGRHRSTSRARSQTPALTARRIAGTPRSRTRSSAARSGTRSAPAKPSAFTEMPCHASRSRGTTQSRRRVARRLYDRRPGATPTQPRSSRASAALSAAAWPGSRAASAATSATAAGKGRASRAAPGERAAASRRASSGNAVRVPSGSGTSWRCLWRWLAPEAAPEL